jgi:hypothetical protein
MKYALCFRGISYYKDYYHADSPQLFDVDFSQSLGSFQKNIINPLKETGHDVDVFFTTYDSIKLQEYIDIMKPKAVKLNSYQYLAPGTWRNVLNMIIDTLNLIKNTNVHYDYIIISRFDNFIFENILNVFIAENALSSISKGEDNFFIISGSILDLVYNYFIELINKNAVSHSYTEYFLSKGLRCHKFYKEIKDQKNHPFLKTTRQLFTPINHTFHLCNLEDLYNPHSEFYGFLYEPVKEFTSS